MKEKKNELEGVTQINEGEGGCRGEEQKSLHYTFLCSIRETIQINYIQAFNATVGVSQCMAFNTNNSKLK